MHRLTALIVRYGTPLVWLNVFLEQIGLPIPALPTVILAGALSRDGHMSSTAILVGSVLASLLADWFWFLLGRRYGYRVLRTLCRISLSPDSCVRDTESRFDRWGMRSLLVAKFIPGFSTIAPPLAGASGHGVGQFLIYDAVGAFIWAGAAVAAGRAFHRALDRLLLGIEQLGGWALVLIASVLALVIVIKWWQRIKFLQRLRVARITPEELLAMMESSTPPLIIDARSESGRRHDPRRLPHAIVIPAGEMPARLASLSRDREIILYCT